MNAPFHSPLAARLQAFLEMRCSLGRHGKSDFKILRYLDRFLTRRLAADGTITAEVAAQWLASMNQLSPGTRINRVSILRQFCRYLKHFDQRTCEVPRSCLPRRTRLAPYIYSRAEVRRLMAAARRIGPRCSIWPEMLATLLGLLFATGLRISEALGLTLGDVDLDRRLLVIRQTKFKKSRYVPLSPSTAAALSRYLKHRARFRLPDDPAAIFFRSPRGGGRIGQSTIATVFLRLARDLKIRGPRGERGPRIHDFRHSFAVHRLMSWYRERAEVQAKLPILSTYLGHTTLIGTQVYLQATAELLEQVSRRFRKSAPAAVLAA